MIVLTIDPKNISHRRFLQLLICVNFQPMFKHIK